MTHEEWKTFEDTLIKRGYRKWTRACYGEENFDVAIVEDNIPSYEELLEKEKYYVSLYDSYNKGYNMTLGGDSNPMSCEKSKDKHDSIMRSESVRKKISDTMKEKHRRGELFTDEHKKHISESQSDWVFVYNENFDLKRIHRKYLEDYIANGWLPYEKRPYDQLCGRIKMTTLKIKTGIFSTRSVECYCILENGERHDFDSIRDGAVWWYENFKPFGEKFAEVTYQRKIKKSIKGEDIKFEIQEKGKKKEYIYITNIRWFKKEGVMQE